MLGVCCRDEQIVHREREDCGDFGCFTRHHAGKNMGLEEPIRFKLLEQGRNVILALRIKAHKIFA